MAQQWVDQGATYLHLVDLDGAKEGRPINGESIQRIVQSARVPCQLGGGMRTEEQIEEALNWGVSRVIVGTKAVTDPTWLEKISRRFPNQVVLGIDAKNGKVAIEGWLEVSDQSAVELARRCANWPLAALVYTDISRDGMMAGPNIRAMEDLSKAVALPIIASGGVTTLDDIRRLAELGLAGCIVGRALYEGRLSLREAINCVQQQSGGNVCGEK
jgi:phosphoribosylformimino-5-aminoimidazole carboxamide ribotide isomerase